MYAWYGGAMEKPTAGSSNAERQNPAAVYAAVSKLYARRQVNGSRK